MTHPYLAKLFLTLYKTSPSPATTELDTEDSYATAAIFAAVLAGVLATVYYVARLGFYNPPEPILKTLGISYFLLFFPHGCRFLVLRARPIFRDDWWASIPFFLLCGLSIITVSGLLIQLRRAETVYVFAAVGVVLCCVMFLRWLSAGFAKKNAIFILFSLFFAIWVSGVAWEPTYHDPLFIERILVSAPVHKDTLFHASITSMIQTYGIPSTGLDGIPYLAYHFGSHWVFARLSSLMGIGSLSFYQLVFPVVFVPMLFNNIVVFGTVLRSSWRQDEFPRSALRTDVVFWAILVVSNIGILPFTIRIEAALGWNSHVISESFSISLSIVFAFLSILLVYWQKARSNPPAVHWVFAVLFLPGMLGLIGLLKSSSMVVLMATGLYLLVRLRLYRKKVYVVVFVLTLATCLLLYSRINYSEPGYSQVYPFHFLFVYVRRYWRVFWILGYIFWPLTYVVARLRSEKIHTDVELWRAIRRRHLIDLEVIIVVSLLGALPGLVLDIPGGSAVYFSDVQKWLTVGICLGGLPLIRREVRGFWSTHSPILGTARLSRTLLLAVGTISVTSLALNFLLQISWPIANNLHTRSLFGDFNRFLPAETVVEEARDISRPSLENFPFNRVTVKQPPNYEMLQVLSALSGLPDAIKEQTLLLVPQSNFLYWHLQADCMTTPFVAPAISTLAMLDGTPASDCNPAYYGYYLYDRRRQEQTLSADDPEELCSRAEERNFSRIIVLDSDSDARLTISEILCQ